jgi:Protein of unknown function (DUF2695)
MREGTGRATTEEKQQRKGWRHPMAQQKPARAEANPPISKSALKKLLDYLDERLAERSCDDRRRYTREFLSNRSLSQERIVNWLRAYGGFCDCEALANVEDGWGEIVGST